MNKLPTHRLILRIVIAVIGITTGGLLLANIFWNSTPSASGTPVAIVGDSVFYESQLQQEHSQQMNQVIAERALAGEKWNLSDKEKKQVGEKVKQEIVNNAIERLLLVEQAKAEGYTPKTAAVDEYLEEQFGSVEMAEQRFMEIHGEPERGREAVAEMLMVSEYIKETIPEIEVSEKEAREFFDAYIETLREEGSGPLRPLVTDSPRVAGDEESFHTDPDEIDFEDAQEHVMKILKYHYEVQAIEQLLDELKSNFEIKINTEYMDATDYSKLASPLKVDSSSPDEGPSFNPRRKRGDQ